LEYQEFSIETALDAAGALHRVLAARTHRRKVMGQEVWVPGQLGEALHLPRIMRRLQSKQQKQREQGLDEFHELWPTLSPATREKVLHRIGWYNPKELDWEDKRSNRRPIPDADA
jgi:Ser/Thr protein kinase RdoA (MazF antagonist)